MTMTYSPKLMALCSTALIGSVIAAPIASAQIDVVVTTAQRQSQNLQDVPVSVTAVTIEEIEDRQVYDLLDLQTLVPNINLGTNTGTANAARIFLRGVGEDESRGAVDQAVGIYVDGVYVGRSVGSLFDVVDLEQIEVLRGPQGTLYGRNSNGGAIKLTSVKPQMGETSGDLRLTFGNNARFDARAVGNLAIGETTAVRATIMQRKRDGFHTLNPTGAFAADAGTEVGEQDVLAARLMFSQDFGADWNLLIALDRTEDDSDPTPDSKPAGFDQDDNIFTIEPDAGVNCASVFQFGCYTTYSNSTMTQGANATLTGSIGGFDITSITGYRQMEDDLVTRITFPYRQQTEQDQFSQELTAASNFDGMFNFVAGLYYFTENLQLAQNFAFLPSTIDTETRSASVFGQGIFDVTDKFALTGGIRVTSEEKDFEGNGAAGSRIDDANFDNVSYSVKADYDLSSDHMVYMSYATGFKSGGWSPDAFSPTAVYTPVNEEEVGTFELGMRSEFWDNRFQLNSTYFFSNYKDLQIGATVPGVGFTRFNVPETEISGLEFEWRFVPTDAFTLSGNIGLLDAEYTDVTDGLTNPAIGGLTNAGVPCPGGVATEACALDLNLKNAPEYKASIAATYKQNLFGGEMTYSGDINFEDNAWTLVANAPSLAQVEIPTLVNGRIKYQPESAGWSVAVWGKNLSDEEYYRVGSGGSNAAFGAYAAEPSTYGVDLGISF